MDDLSKAPCEGYPQPVFLIPSHVLGLFFPVVRAANHTGCLVERTLGQRTKTLSKE